MSDPKQYDLAALKSALLGHLGEKADACPEQTIQQFPHVASRLAELWGTPAGERYLQELLVSDRPGRQGFPADVASEIFRLSLIHGTSVAQRAGPAAKSAWGDPTEVQLRADPEALQKIADERAAARRQRDAASDASDKKS